MSYHVPAYLVLFVIMPSLSEILDTKIIPWSQQQAASRIILASSEMSQEQMPSGVRLDRRNIPSKRVLVKNKRVYNNVRNVIATWPDAGLQELGKYALACVFDGAVDYPLGNYKLRCDEGHFIFIPPGIPWSDGSRTYMDLEKSPSCDILVFLLHPGALEMWISHCHTEGRDSHNNCLIFRQHTITLFEMLIDEVVHEKMQRTSLVTNLLGAFFEVVLRDLEQRDFQQIHHPLQTAGMSKAALDDFETHLGNYVQANLQHSLKLNVVARDMYLSPAQFSRVIRRETGKSFVEYVTEKRLQKAKELLIESDWSIKAIFSICGFSSLEYFCAVFKKHFQQTPSQYRKNPQK